MPDEPDPTFGLTALAQSLPQDRPMTIPEWGSINPNISFDDILPFVRHFYRWCQARDLEDEARRQARREADAAYEEMERQENGGGGEGL